MSKPRTGFLATCPCCGEKVKVDARLRRLDPMDPSKKKPSKLLDDASDVLETEEQARQQSFDRALDEETGGKKSSLDDFLD